MQESAYCAALTHDLASHGIPHELQKPVPFYYRGERLGTAFCTDLIVDSQLLIELKSTKHLEVVHFFSR